MGRKVIGKTTIYYGTGDIAQERGGRMDAAATRRGYINSRSEPELSPLFVYAFEFIDHLNPAIEDEAKRQGIDPWELVNQLFEKYAKRKEPPYTDAGSSTIVE